MDAPGPRPAPKTRKVNPATTRKQQRKHPKSIRKELRPLFCPSKRIAEINAFMLRSSLYIDDPDRQLVNSYIQAAHRFHEVVRSGEIDADINLGDTAIIPEEVLQQCKALRESQKSALALRETLLNKIRSVLSKAA
jgi:hypothetical protein